MIQFAFRLVMKFPATCRLFVFVGVLIRPKVVLADVIDDAMAAGNRSFAAGNIEEAINSYENARQLLPGTSATLSYNLGTAYARRGDLGRAVFHLRKALQPQAQASLEVRDTAQRNLGIVRRRAEIQAAASGAQLSANESWRELISSVLASPAVGWISMLSAWAALLIFAIRKLRKKSQERGIAIVLQYGLLGIYVVLGGLHLLASGGSYRSDDAIAIPSTTDVREGPGLHRKVQFVLQGGSLVTVVEKSAGWSKIRLPGGLEGWLANSSIAPLDAGL